MSSLSALPDDVLAVTRMRRRVRLLRALRGALELSLWGAALAVLTLLGARLGVVSKPRALVGFALALGLPLVGALVGGLRRVPALFAAQLLDRHYRLDDRLSSALQFRALPEAEQSPWMRAAIDDATAHAKALDARAALRWQWPAEARAVIGMLAVLGAVALVEFRVARVIAVARPTRDVVRDPLVLEDDDLAAFRELSRQLDRDARTPAARDSVREFQRFLDDVAQRRLERQEAYRRLATLQQTLDANQREDRDALRQTLARMGQRMDGAMTREVSQALQQGDLQRAQEAMQRLADQLRQDRQLSEQQRRELQRALQQGAEPQRREELQRQLEQARRDVAELQRRQRERELNNGERELLRRRQRDQERLTREQEREEQLRREVEHLQRELAQAAQDMMRDAGATSQDLQRSAEQLSRLQDEQQSQQSLEELRQRLQELRDQMRQQNGQNGQRQRARLARFFRAAGAQGNGQGQQGQQGGAQGNGQQGNGQQGGGQQGNGPGQQGGGNDGNGAGMAQGTNGQPGGQVLGLRPGAGGGAMVPMGAGGQQGNGQGQQGSGEQGHGAGTEHADDARGAAVHALGASQSVQVHGQQSGNGPSRSQVIRSAATDGFANAPYRQVYNPYWDRAREALHQGDVPAGYRSYVRRYFQLIRPRDEQ